jgi:hypothetical protein
VWNTSVIAYHIIICQVIIIFLLLTDVMQVFRLCSIVGEQFFIQNAICSIILSVFFIILKISIQDYIRTISQPCLYKISLLENVNVLSRV